MIIITLDNIFISLPIYLCIRGSGSMKVVLEMPVNRFEGKTRISPKRPPVHNTCTKVPQQMNIHCTTIFPCNKSLSQYRSAQCHISVIVYYMYTYHREWQTPYKISPNTALLYDRKQNQQIHRVKYVLPLPEVHNVCNMDQAAVPVILEVKSTATSFDVWQLDQIQFIDIHNNTIVALK